MCVPRKTLIVLFTGVAAGIGAAVVTGFAQQGSGMFADRNAVAARTCRAVLLRVGYRRISVPQALATRSRYGVYSSGSRPSRRARLARQ